MPDQDKLSKIVFIIDDNKEVIEVMKLHLEKEGYAVLAAETAKKAFYELAHRPKMHAVCLDIGLPDMDGLELLQKIKEIHPSLCVIMVTGCHEETKGRRAIELGAWDYVTKPIDFQYLIKLLGSF